MVSMANWGEFRPKKALRTVLVGAAVAFTAVIAGGPGMPAATAADLPACGVQEPGASAAAEKLVNDACTKIGVDYAWGGGHAAQPGETKGLCDPANGAPNDCNVTGFDCSGFSRWAYASAAGNDMLTNGTAANQYKVLSDKGFGNVDLATVKAGDLLYYGTAPGNIHHVAIALGKGYTVEAMNSGTKIKVNTSQGGHTDLLGAKRPLP